MHTHGVLQVQHPHNVIKVFFIDRISAVALLEHKIKCILKRHGTVDRHNVIAVCHDIVCLLVAKFKDIGDHLNLSGFKHTMLMPLRHHGDDFLLRDIHLFLLIAQPEYPQQAVCRDRDNPCERIQHRS